MTGSGVSSHRPLPTANCQPPTPYNRGVAEEKLYKIGEVCKLADVQPYVLRYWETEFPQLAPNKSGGGQRLYTRHEIDVILRIKELLYREGFTIAGAKKKLETDAAEAANPAPVVDQIPAAEAAAATLPSADVLAEVKSELREILRILSV
jgi:DNA-binding transcriptional MerR regulator